MNNKERLLQIGSTVGILLVVFLAVLSIKEIKSIGYVGKDTPIMNSISVNGKGEAVSIPDIATFSFSVTETAKTVAEAQAKATEKTNSALSAVKAGGVADKDIKTLSYSINPHYEYTQGACTTYGCPGGKSVLTGYDVSQTIQVKVRDLTKAGALFDSIGSVGVQNVNGLAFSIDNIDSVKAVARAEAIAQAKTKAQKIAKDLGVTLVRITSFYDSSDDVIYPYARDAAMGGAETMNIKAVAPQIPTGEQKITANVSITYEIR
jgi:uncharacterized protein YggE